MLTSCYCLFAFSARQWETLCKRLCYHLFLQPSESDSSKRKLSLDDHTHIYSLESHIETLRDELSGTQTHIELLQAELDNQDEQMRKKDEQLSKLHNKVWQLTH